LANEPGQFPHAGVVDFVDNKVDPSTGTLKVRAVVSNPMGGERGTECSRPGFSSAFRVPLGEPRRQLPRDRAAPFGSDQGQKYLFVVVKKDGKEIVEYRPVGIGPG